MDLYGMIQKTLDFLNMGGLDSRMENQRGCRGFGGCASGTCSIARSVETLTSRRMPDVQGEFHNGSTLPSDCSISLKLRG